VRLRKSLKNNANILRFVGRPDETIEKAAFSHGLNTDETRMGNRRRVHADADARREWAKPEGDFMELLTGLTR
jgi:hypothetical protein